MNGKIIIIAAVIIVLICTGMIIVLHNTANKRTFDTPPEITETEIDTKDINVDDFSFSYTSGGGMEGGHCFIDITKKDDNKALFSIDKQEYNGAKTKKKKYAVDIKYLKQIKALYVKYGVENWTNLETSEYEVLDAPSTTWHFTDGKTSISISDIDVLPKESDNKIFSSIRAILDECEKK